MDTNVVFEFNKLDAVDYKVACWLNSESPCELYDYLEFIAKKYHRTKGITLNVKKAFHQLVEIEPDFSTTDLIALR